MHRLIAFHIQIEPHRARFVVGPLDFEQDRPAPAVHGPERNLESEPVPLAFPGLCVLPGLGTALPDRRIREKSAQRRSGQITGENPRSDLQLRSGSGGFPLILRAVDGHRETPPGRNSLRVFDLRLQVVELLRQLSGPQGKALHAGCPDWIEGAPAQHLFLLRVAELQREFPRRERFVRIVSVRLRHAVEIRRSRSDFEDNLLIGRKGGLVKHQVERDEAAEFGGDLPPGQRAVVNFELIDRSVGRADETVRLRRGADQQLFHLAEIEVADPDRFLIHPGRTDLVRQSVDIDRAPAAVVIDEREMNPVAGVIDRPHHAGQRNRLEVAAARKIGAQPVPPEDVHGVFPALILPGKQMVPRHRIAHLALPVRPEPEAERPLRRIQPDRETDPGVSVPQGADHCRLTAQTGFERDAAAPRRPDRPRVGRTVERRIQNRRSRRVGRRIRRLELLERGAAEREVAAVSVSLHLRKFPEIEVDAADILPVAADFDETAAVFEFELRPGV